MALRVALFLLMCGLLYSTSDKSGAAEQAKCIGTCKNSCNRSYDSCKKNATTKTAIQACQKSLDTCGSNCVNKACK
jgi:hypothetical protein